MSSNTLESRLDVSYPLIKNAVLNFVIVKISSLIAINCVDASDWNQVVIILFLWILFVFPLILVKRRWWAKSDIWKKLRYSQKLTSQCTSVHQGCSQEMMLTTICLILLTKILILLTPRVDGLFMGGAKYVWLMMVVYWVIISRSLVIISFFLRRYQLMLYIFTHRRNNISTFLQFIGGLLTTSNFTFLHYKYVIAINPSVDMSS